MSVAFRAGANVTNGTAGTSVTVSRPSGTVDGDCLVAFVAQAGTASVTAPTGWTLLGSATTSSTVTLAVYYKRASGEPSSWTWTLGASARNWGWVGAYTGVDPSAPISASTSLAFPSGGTAFELSPALSPLLRFGLGISAAAGVRTASGSATTWTPSGTERADLSTNAGSGTDIAGEVQDSVNGTGVDTAYGPILTASQSQAQAVVWAVALNPYWQPPAISATVSMTVEAAIGADLTADAGTWTWMDLTGRAKHTARIVRGRPDERGTTQPSSLTLRLDNPDGWLTPNHPMSPWRQLWDLGTPFRLKINQVIGSFVRFQGRVTRIDPVWPSGNDTIAWVDIEAKGTLYHLEQGEALHSPLYRVISGDGPVRFWALEDGPGATSLAEAGGGPPMTYAGGPPTLGSAGPAGAASVLTMAGGSTLHGSVSMSPSVTAWTVESYFSVPSAPGLAATPIWEWACTSGTIRLWRACVFVVGGTDEIGLEGYDASGTKVIDDHASFSVDGVEAYGMDLMLEVTVRQNGGNIEWELFISTGTTGFGTFTAGSIAGTIGPIGYVDTPFVVDGWKYGAVSVWDRSLDLTWGNFNFTHPVYLAGSAGDLATTRIFQIGASTGVPIGLRGTGPGYTLPAFLGPIPAGSALDVMRDAEKADIGILTDGLGAGLSYLSRPWRYNLPVTLALDASRGQVKVGFAPSRGDERLRNKVTVSRSGGSSATALDASSTTIGVYPDQQTLNLYDDSRLAHQAGFRLHMSTTREMRVPTLTVDLRNSPELIRSWLERCDIGTRYTATNLLDQFPPEGLDLVIEQYIETIDAVTWRVDLTGSPFTPWRVWVLGDPVYGRLGTGGSQLAADAALGATSLSVTVTGTQLWTTDVADYPIDLDVAGIKVTAVVASNNINPLFELDASNWTGNGGSIVRSTALAHTGIASLQLTPTGVALNSYAEAEQTPVTVGASYVASGWFYSTATAPNVATRVNWWDSGHGYLSTSVAGDVALPNGVWTFVTNTLTAPASAAYGSVHAGMFGSTPAASKIINLDEVRLHAVASPQAFVVTGVTKALHAGDPVALWKPPVIAL